MVFLIKYIKINILVYIKIIKYKKLLLEVFKTFSYFKLNLIKDFN